MTFQRVVIDESYQRVGMLVLASGHVNLVLGRAAPRTLEGRIGDYSLVVDFLPPPELAGTRAVPIAEATITAMYMNNRARRIAGRRRRRAGLCLCARSGADRPGLRRQPTRWASSIATWGCCPRPSRRCATRW